MRIHDLVALSLGTTPYSTGRKSREAGAARQGAEDQSGGRGRLASPKVNFRAAPSRDVTPDSAPATRRDTVELSSPGTRASRGAAARRGASEQTQAPAPSVGEAPLAGVTDEFTRQRAVYTYTMPIANGGTFSLTYEVESSYRVIRFLEPGQLIDAEA